MENLNNCPNCGQPVVPGDKFCRNCGKPFVERLSETPPPLPPSPPEIPPPIPPVPPIGQAGAPPPEDKYVPWEDRARVGFFEALWLTWKESVFGPEKFFSRLPYTGGLGAPILFALIIGWFYVIAMTIYDWIFAGFWLSIASRFLDSTDALIPLAAKGGSDVLTLFLAPIFVIIGLFVVSGIYHLIMMIFGWAKRDFEATLRAVAYSSGPLVFVIIPMCGSPIGIIWGLILTIIGFKHMQQTTGGKATFTVLLPLLLCCCLAFLLSVLFGAAILAFFQGFSGEGIGY